MASVRATDTTCSHQCRFGGPACLDPEGRSARPCVQWRGSPGDKIIARFTTREQITKNGSAPSPKGVALVRNGLDCTGDQSRAGQRQGTRSQGWHQRGNPVIRDRGPCQGRRRLPWSPWHVLRPRLGMALRTGSFATSPCQFLGFSLIFVCFAKCSLDGRGARGPSDSSTPS